MLIGITVYGWQGISCRQEQAFAAQAHRHDRQFKYAIRDCTGCSKHKALTTIATNASTSDTEPEKSTRASGQEKTVVIELKGCGL
jgi:hypothetical protein